VSMLELSSLTKNFGKLVAVDGVDITVEEGHIAGLIGPNGSGKSTVFNLVTGFIRPTRGRIMFQGSEITGHQPHTIASMGIGRVFQQNLLFEQMTVFQNVDMACHLHVNIGIWKQVSRIGQPYEKEKAIERNIISALETMGIAHLKDEIATDLPHGHQRALAMAMALATQPKLLMLDEPVTGMNETEKADMVARMRTLRESGITILLVEHDMKTIMTICDKITVLNFGKKISEGTAEEVSKHKDVIEAYLGAEL